MGRQGLIQVGYEMALRRYGERHNREQVRAARAYLAAVGETNQLLATEIEARLAEWVPPEVEEELWEPALSDVGEWQRLRAEIERIGFRDGVRDVLHFAPGEKGETQLAAWWELAEIAEDPDQAAIDEYLRGLAPEGLVYVPAGPFLMGSADDDPDAIDNEKPQHEVNLPGYYIGRYPVTNEEHAEFIAAGGYEEYWKEAIEAGRWEDGQYNDYLSSLRGQPEYWDDENYNRPRQPVVGVSWYEAAAYCRWRGLRLPTEAEWEKAAGWDPHAGRKRKYPWGDEWEEDRGNWERKVGRATPVGE